MAVVQTKYVTVGINPVTATITLTGFYTGGLNFGTISNTSGGSSATNLYSVSAQTTVESINHSSYGSGALVFTLKGNYAVPSNAGFDTLKIAGNSFSRTAATSTTNTSNKTRTWTWSGASNPFGSVNNAVKTVTWETTTATYSVTAPTSINEGSTGTINVATTNVANSTTLYYTVQGIPFNTNNASPSDFGVSSYPSGSFSISSNAGSFTLTVTADLTTEGQEAAQVDIRTGSTSGTVVATDTFNIIDTSTTPASDTTPNAFSFTDKTGNVSTEQNSSVQITGINAATTVSRTSGTATFAVVGTSTTPSTSNFGTSNTTITNNQYLHVKQTTSSSYSTSLSTVMNVGGVTDTWTTTTSSSTYTLTAPTSIDEGSSGTFNIATTNVSTGTSLYWSITSPTQFTGSTTGTVTTNSSGAASFSVTPTADSTTEGALTVTARIRTGSQGGTIVDSDTFVVNDTSTTPGGSGGGGQSGGSGSTGYGLEIFGPNNTSVVFGSDLRCTSIQVYDSRLYSGNSSHSFTGIADATDSAKVEVVLSSAYGTSTASYGYARTSANGGTVTVSNTQSGARTIETVILRIG